MPLLIARRLYTSNRTFYLSLPTLLASSYPQARSNSTSAMTTLMKVYNEEGRPVQELNITRPFQLFSRGNYLNITDVANEHGIPANYNLECLISNLTFITENGSINIIPIFPGELKSYIATSNSELDRFIEQRVERLREIAEAYETIGELWSNELFNYARELQEGLTEVDRDPGNAVRHFRNIFDGLRNAIRRREDEKLNRFLRTTFHLLSGYGQHFRTRTSLEDAIFARNLAVATLRFLIRDSEILNRLRSQEGEA
jgi:hypothetical protein